MTDQVASAPVEYIPSTVEKKRAISGLFFVGIMMMLGVQRELSVFERYYLALALALRSIGLIMFLVAVLVFFLSSILGYLYVLVLLARFGIWGYSITQARAGTYNHSFVAMRLLVGFGNWMLGLFLIDEASSPTQSPSPEETPTPTVSE